jgi:hypothetical protein
MYTQTTKELAPSLQIGTRLNEFRDDSGLITVSVFSLMAPNAQQHFSNFGVAVSPDMICVGGGGVASEGPPGALLTASYPNDQLTGWLVSSKDHQQANPHFLTAYAIGMKIEGIDRSRYLSQEHLINVDIRPSGTGSHPQATAFAADGYVLISGGFNVEYHGAGNLGTASFPENTTSWTARSKDHTTEDPANLNAFAISLNPNLPIGRVEGIQQPAGPSGQAEHPRMTAGLPQGFAMTGGGADVDYGDGAGNLLWMLEPTTKTAFQDFTAASKDQLVSCSATITTYILGIRIRR